MIPKAFEALAPYAERAVTLWLSTQVIGNAATVLLMFLLAALMTRNQRRSWRDLASRNVMHDGVWAAFYLGGFYSVLVGGPVYRLLSTAADRAFPWIRVGVLSETNPIAAFVVLWLALDLIGYWWHRLAHTAPFLWEFHKVHHGQSQLTPLTNYRFHFVDICTRTTLQFIPGIILGAPAVSWMAVVWVQIAFEVMTHADLSWSYGPLGVVINNPRFHRVHHSTEERHHGRNFGLSFCLWDRLFGTAVLTAERPAAYGLPNEAARTLFDQIFGPFKAVLGVRKSRAVSPPPLPAATPPAQT